MGYTLDQLLDTTGVGDLAGRNLKKVAAKQDPKELSKLAARCREASEIKAEERPAIDEHDLVEKTAAVQIIRRTIAEIREIENDGSEKVASEESPQQAAFIKAALAAGHNPEAIASFLEKRPGSPPALPKEKRRKSSSTIVG